MFEDELRIRSRHTGEHKCRMAPNATQCDVITLYNKLEATRGLYYRQREFATDRGRQIDELRRKLNQND